MASRAVHGGLSGVIVAVDLSLEADLGLVALFSESNLILFGHVKNILAETVSGWFVPVAGSSVANGEVDLLVRTNAGSSSGVLFDLDIGEVLGVPGILGQTNGGVEEDESTILLFSDHSRSHEVSVTALQVLEDTSENGAEFRSNGSGGENLRL